MKPARILFSFLFSFITATSFGQSDAEVKRKLKGTWIKIDGRIDTLKFYVDNNGVDFGVSGSSPELPQGFYLEIQGDTARIERMCGGQIVKSHYSIDETNQILAIDDFYDTSGKRLTFRKISDKVW